MDRKNVKQLYEKIGGDYVPVDPKISLESILESLTERSIAYILHHYNHFNATWTNTQEDTRAQVPPQIRRNNLWLSYNIKGKRKVTERFIGTDRDAATYERWIDSEYWEEMDFELLKAGVREAVENIFNNLDKFPQFKEFLKKLLMCMLSKIMDPDWLEDLIKGIIGDLIQDYLEQYFSSPEFKAWLELIIGDLIMDLLLDLIDEYFKDIQQTLWDEERVIANALARHEMQLQEHERRITALENNT